MAVHDGQQHRQPRRLQADGQAPGTGALGVVDERLDFDKQRTGAFLGHEHATAGNFGVVLREEKRGGVGNAFQPALGHGEDAEFVDRAEAVLECADQSETGMRVALEVQDGVDDVFEHARPRERAVLGDVADEYERRSTLLGVPCQLRRAFAHLSDGTGRGLQVFGI